MSNNNRYKGLNWKLIAVLSAIALSRPIMSMTGISEAIGKPVTSITSTIMITFIWITAVVIKNEPKPLLTLLFAGMGYGIFAIIISGIFSPILTGHLQGPLTNPFAFVSVLATNAIWGLLSGAIAMMFIKIKQHA